MSCRSAGAAGAGAGAECRSVSEAICLVDSCGRVQYARWLYQKGGRDVVVRSNQNH